MTFLQNHFEVKKMETIKIGKNTKPVLLKNTFKNMNKKWFTFGVVEARMATNREMLVEN